MKIEYIVMNNSHSNALLVERMRYQAYGVKQYIEETDLYYLKEIEDGSILVFICMVDDKIVSACYISNFQGNLYVDYLFTLPQYQKQKLYYGKKLLQYIINNKQIVEEYFHRKFTQSLLCPGSNSVKEFYKSLGYTENNNETLMMSKKI
ncbi:MAG: GNAT family N-acetyltransferase [Candidatus Coprovivens sp.]